MPTWRDYAPPTHQAGVFVLVMGVSAVGLGLFLSGSAIYYSTVVGLTVGQIGTGLSIAAVVGLLATVPLGAAADRLGGARMLVAIMAWRAAWFVALAFVEGPVTFTLVACCLAVAEAGTAPTVQSVVAVIAAGEDRTRTMAILRTVRNIGFSLGALLAGVLVVEGSSVAYRALVLVNAAAFLVAAVLLARLGLPATAVARRSSPWAVLRQVDDHRFLALAAVNGAMSLHISVLGIGLPLWILTSDVLPPAVVPGAVLLNTLLVVVLQVPFSAGTEQPGRARRALRLAGWSLAATAVCLAVVPDLPLAPALAALAVGTVLLTCGELWQAAGGWELSFAYARDDRRTLDLATFNLGAGLQSVAGPGLVTAAVTLGRPGWFLLAALFSVLALLVGPTVGALERHRATRTGHVVLD